MKKLSIFLPMLFLLSGCTNITVLDPKSATGKDQAYLIWLGFGVMSIVIAVVFLLLAKVVITYRTKKHEESRPIHYLDEKKQKILEITWTTIPFILLIILAVPTIPMTLEQSPVSEAEATYEGEHIDVNARQFEWAFTYETGKMEKNMLVIPEGEPIILHLTSEDVIHSFWVPELAGKIDVMPEKTIVYQIENPEIGEYAGKCAEFCGVQHANMTFTVKVVSKAEYKEYITH